MTPTCIEIHLASDGCDGHSGLEDSAPVRSLARAQAIAREAKVRWPSAPVQVWIAGGTYELAETLTFTAADSGSAKAPVTYSARPGEKVILSGGRRLSGWREDTVNGLSCWSLVLPEVAAGKWWFTQLFVNGSRRYRARLPKRGFYHFTGVPEEEVQKDPGGYFHGAMSACFKPGEMKAFQNLADVEVVVPDHWYENHLRVDRVDEASSTVYFRTKGYSRFSRDETGKFARYAINHALEALTDPGEWYLDRPSGTLYYRPLPGEVLNAVEIVAPRLETLLLVAGEPEAGEAGKVRQLCFERLEFRHQEWSLPPENAGALQSAFNVPAALRLVGAEDCAFFACQVSRVAGYGLEVMRGSSRNRILACAFFDLGAGGVKIGHEGGMVKSWVEGAFRGLDYQALGWGPAQGEGGRIPGRDRSPGAQTIVSDCSIHDGGKLFYSAIGVWIGDSGRNRIRHNHIYNFNYSGISCGWNWGYSPVYAIDNRIEFNHIHDIGHGMLSDMGAIYTLGPQPGSTIRGNLIHSVESYGYGGWGIYPDEGSSWLVIENNLVYNTKCGGIHQHYGRDNLVRNNLFLLSRESQLQFSRHEFVRCLTFTSNVVFGAQNSQLISGNGWRTARFDRNLYGQESPRPSRFCNLEWVGWRQFGHDRKSLFADLLFLDPASGELAPANPAALKKIGFDLNALDVRKAGPRFRDRALPRNLASYPREKEKPRGILDSRFWPWPAEWPEAGKECAKYHNLASFWPVKAGEAMPLSLTLENGGGTFVKGRYRLAVEPAAAATITGPRSIRFNLKPGERQALDWSLIPSGKQARFRVELLAEGEGVLPSALFFLVQKLLALPRQPALAQVEAVPAALAGAPLIRVRSVQGEEMGHLRLGLAGGELILAGEILESELCQADPLAKGSCIELFAAKANGEPHRQVLLGPADGKRQARAVVVVNGKHEETLEVAMRQEAVAAGYRLWAKVPLTLLGVAPEATEFVFDLALRAKPAGALAYRRQTYSEGSSPGQDSSDYARVHVTRKKTKPTGGAI